MDYKTSLAVMAASMSLQNQAAFHHAQDPRVSGLRFKGTAGHIFGMDPGQGPRRQPRNKPCSCGSGLKAKKCHVYYVPHGTPPLGQEEDNGTSDTPQS